MELTAFYRSRNGVILRRRLRRALRNLNSHDWRQRRVLGTGFTRPFLPRNAKNLRLTDFDKTERLEAQDANADIILAVHAFSQITKPRRFLRELWRVLDDEGEAIIITMTLHKAWATPFPPEEPEHNSLKAIAIDQNFTVIDSAYAITAPHMLSRLGLRSYITLDHYISQLCPQASDVQILHLRKRQVSGLVIPAKRDIRPQPQTSVT